MIKINLLAERKPTKAKSTAGLKIEGAGSGSNVLLIGILLLGVLVAGGWWWMLDSSIENWNDQLARDDAELKRLEGAIKKSEEFEAQKALLTRKINLITDLKKQQAVPVHILDQISRNLPDFLWLDSLNAKENQITIAGKATTYTAVSNFYSNLNESGLFADVALGRTFEVKEGVSFSLTCAYVGQPGEVEQPQG